MRPYHVVDNTAQNVNQQRNRYNENHTSSWVSVCMINIFDKPT